MNGRQFSSNLLSESFYSEDLETSLHRIVGGHKIELSSIIQQTSGEFIIYESFSPILGTNEASKRVWIQTGYAPGSFHWASSFKGETSGAGGEVCTCTLAFAAIVVLGGPLGCRGLCTFFAWGQFLTKWSGLYTDKGVLLLLFINLDGPGHPYCESPFSVFRFTKKVRNVEARVVIWGNVSIRCGLLWGTKPRVC